MEQEKISVAKELMSVFLELKQLGVISEREFNNKRTEMIGAVGHIFGVAPETNNNNKASMFQGVETPTASPRAETPRTMTENKMEQPKPTKQPELNLSSSELKELDSMLEEIKPSLSASSTVSSNSSASHRETTLIRATPSSTNLGPKKKIKFKPIKQIVALSGHEKNVFAMCLQNNTFFSGGKDSTIRAWNIATAKTTKSWKAHDDAVYCLANTDKHLISGSWDKKIKLWNISSYEELAALPGHNNYVSALCPVGSKTLYSGGFDCTIHKWDLETQQIESSIVPQNMTNVITNGHNKPITQLMYCEAERELISASQDGSIKIWNSNNDCQHTYQLHEDWIYQIARRDNLIFTASRDKTIKVVDRRKEELLAEIEGHSGYVMSLALSGSLLFSGSMDGTIKIWNIHDFECVQTIEKAHNGAAYQLLAIGNTLFSGSWDSLIKVWQ